MAEILSADGMRAQWPAQQSRLAALFEAFCQSMFKFYCPLTVHGHSNIPDPPFLICSNHASHLDATMLMVASGISFQKIGLIAAKDYFFDQSHRFFLHRMMNLVPIARGAGTRGIKDSAIACRSFLQSGGQALVIFPEGTRSLTGKIATFKDGAAMLAHDLDLPMVPAYVAGSHTSLPKGSYFLRPHQLSVSFGEHLRVSDHLTLSEDGERRAVFNAYREATLEIERRVRAMAEG